MSTPEPGGGLFPSPGLDPTPSLYPAAPGELMGGHLVDALQPWMTTELSWYAIGLGTMFDAVANLVYDQGVDGQPGFVPGYGALLDPTNPLCDPAFLGQFVGVAVPAGSDRATALSLVTAEAGQKRGTLASVVAAAQRNLTGTQYVSIQERLGPDGSTAMAYWFNMFVLASQVMNLTQLTNDVNAVLPGGVFCTITASNYPTWSVASLQWQNVGAGVSWNNVQVGQV